MNNLTKTILLLFTISFAMNLNAQITGLTNLVKKTDPSIIKIYTINSNGEYERQGSGVLINGTGMAISNFHVLAGAKKAVAITNLGSKFEIKTIIDYSEKNDLIKFQLNTGTKVTTPAAFSTLKLEKGMDVYALGFPNGFEIEGGSTVSTGIISGFRIINEQNLIQTTTPITHGSSGGGLFDATGKLIGITSGTFASDIKDRHANLNKVIQISDIKKLVGKLNLTLNDLYNQLSRDNLFILAMEAYESKEYNVSIDYFVKHLESFPDDAIAWFRLGNCFNQLGRGNINTDLLEKALICFNYAIELDNTHYHSYGQASLVYMLLNQIDLAFEYGNKAYEIAPKIGFNNYVLGRLYNQQRKYQMAITYFDKAIQYSTSLDPLHQWYLERAISHGWLEEHSLAELDYKKCLELNPYNQDGLFNYLNFLLLRKRNSDACVYLNKLYNLNPNYPSGQNSLKDYIKYYCK
jgi:tetratricopeptide (TPR) repeat protein